MILPFPAALFIVDFHYKTGLFYSDFNNRIRLLQQLILYFFVYIMYNKTTLNYA